MEDEGRLVAGLRAGDPAAFDAVYDRFRPRVFGFLARMTRDRVAAEDLLQETFLRLARSARELPEATRLGPFLFTVARNLHVDRRRRQRLDFDRLRDLALWPGRPKASLESPFDLTEADEARRALEGALLDLPEAHREAVLLVAVEGLSPAEAATVLDVTPETLRQRLARGRRALREALEAR